MDRIWIVCTFRHEKYPSGDTTQIHSPAFENEAAANKFADDLNSRYEESEKERKQGAHANAGSLWISTLLK